MSAIRIGDWVQFTPDAIRRFERFLNTIDRASAGMGATLRPNLREGQWGLVVPDSERPPEFLKSRRDPDMVAVRWFDGKVEDARAGHLTRYEPSPARQVLADWLREHGRAKSAVRVTQPDDRGWQKAVAGVWWHHPDARPLCEATDHPDLWEGVWVCALSLRLQREVRAEPNVWGVLLYVETDDGGRATCPIGEDIWPTPESVAEAAEIIQEDEQMRSATTTQTEGT